MPQLNKSEAVYQRLQCFLRRLIGFANYELTECESLERKISVRWIQVESSTPKLIVKTEIRFLAELAFQTAGAKTKANLKQDLRTLKDFLGLLEDNRDRTQGSGLWHFTLTLWHKSVDKNLAAFDKHWQQCKQKSSGSSTSSSQQVFGDAVVSVEHRNSPSGVERDAVVREVKSDFLEVVDVVSQRQDAWIEKKTFEKRDIEKKAVERETGVYHNLPGRDYGTLIGRKQPLQKVLRFLDASYPAARLSVTGVGGIGKTAVVLEAAYECLKVESLQTETEPLSVNQVRSGFGAVIFTVTKKQRFTPHGILHNYRYSQTLQDLFRTIAQTLKCPDALAGDFTRQLETIYELLSYQRTLLIVDNLETLLPESQQAVLSFLYGLPATVKVIVMSRFQLPMDEVIPLTGLDQPESIAFIQQQARLKSVELSSLECQRFFQQTYGIPAAMVYAMGQLAAGYSVSQVLPKLTLTSGDYCRYYLEHTVLSLVGTPAFELLIALSLFPHSASRDALIYIAGLSVDVSDEVITESFVALQQRSLIQSHHQDIHPQDTHHQDSYSERYSERYSMLPLTRDYVLASSDVHLSATRERWLGWYQQWLKAYDHEDWRVWHDYSRVDVEWDALQAVVGWCISEDRYGDFGLLWPGIKGYTHLRGLWAERLSWLEGWLQAVQAGNNDAVTMQVLGDLSWTLLLMGEQQQLVVANQYLSQAWAYSKSLLTESLLTEVLLTEDVRNGNVRSEDVLSEKDFKGPGFSSTPSYQLDLAIDHVVLFLFQSSLDKAAAWLEIANKLIIKGSKKDGEWLHSEAQQMRLDYYTAQLCCRQRDYPRAKSLYRKILQRVQQQLQSSPQSIQHQQAEVYSLNWLVDIALQENDVKEADRLLQQSWPIIHRRKDRRSQAFHQRSKAKLEKRRGNLADFQHWSKQAKACFETLGMHPQAQEMHEWLMANSLQPH